MALEGQLILENLASDPTNGLNAGQVYFNTTENIIKYYNGTAWVKMGTSASTGTGTIPTSGLLIHLDAADANSYSGTGSSWNDLSGNGYNWNVDQASFVGTGIKHFNFGNGYRATRGSGSLSDVPIFSEVTIIAFTRVITSTANFRTFTRGSSSDHHIIISSGSNDIGSYDNDTGGLFKDSGYDVNQITNYSTDFNGWFLRLSVSSPYWGLSFNDDLSDTAQILHSSISLNNGFCVIGGYHNNSINTYQSSNAQSWGDFAAFLYYNRKISYAEQADIYNYYKNTLGI